MSWNINSELYNQCKYKGLTFSHVCEVGVYLPETSNILDFIQEGVKTTLVEPDPKNVKAIRDFFKSYVNVSLFPYAIYDYNGVIELFQRESSTFVSTLTSSPALVNDSYRKNENDNFEVECKTFDFIDDGTIDLLSVDTEGCEWYVVKNIKSRPNVISIETHGKSYINPFMKEISEWFQNNHYVIWYKDKSDSVYMKENLFVITPGERRKLRLKIFSLKLNMIKYRVKKILKGK